MINQTAEDMAAQREERLRKLVADIDAANLDSETLKDHNILAMVLIVRALDIFHARHSEKQVLEIVDFLIEDRRGKRRVPDTEEYRSKQDSMRMWLP